VKGFRVPRETMVAVRPCRVLGYDPYCLRHVSRLRPSFWTAPVAENLPCLSTGRFLDMAMHEGDVRLVSAEPNQRLRSHNRGRRFQ